MSRLYSVVDYDPSCADPMAQAAAGRRPSRMRQRRAEAEMLDALASYLDLAMAIERTQSDPFDHRPNLTASNRSTGGRSC
jgi:hypothetical protein